MALGWKYLIVQTSVVLVVLQLTTTANVGKQQTYAVTPENDSGELCLNHFKYCNPLEYYISDTQKYFSSNVTMVFLTGKHILRNGSVGVSSVHNLTLISYPFYSKNFSILFPTNISCSNLSGFNFTNVSDLTIEGLTFLKCAQLLPHTIAGHTAQAGLAMKNVVNLFMQNVTVLNSIGLGLMAENIFGRSQVKSCTFRDNKGTFNYTIYGGNLKIVFHDCNKRTGNLSIQSSTFNYGYISEHIRDAQATGLQLSVDCSRCSNTTIELDGLVLRRNLGNYGGNMAIYFYNCHYCGCVRVSVLNSLIEDGESFLGAGMFIKIDDDKDSHWNESMSCNETLTLLNVHNTTFKWNAAHITGGAVCSEHHEVENASRKVQVIFSSCNFSYNSAAFNSKFPHGGTAIWLLNYHIPSFRSHIYPQLSAVFENCTFSHNYRSGKYHNGSNAISAALYLDDHPCISISNSTFIDNKCTAIVAVHSNVLFGGEIVIQNNTGGNGGGLVLCDQSFVAFKNHTRLEIVGNKAQLGGGIYIDDSCLDARAPCFFQIESASDWELSDLNNITITMEGNNATYGTAIYGGNTDYCFMFNKQRDITGESIFNHTFKIANESSSLSVVTSDPIGICFCSNESPLNETCIYRSCCSNPPQCCKHSPQCNPHFWNGSLHVYPGGYIELPVVVIGQRLGTVAGSVLATIPAVYTNTNFGNHHKKMLHEINDASCKQSNLYYRIFSPPTSINITLQIQDANNLEYGCYSTLKVSVTIDHCPEGFELNRDNFQCECNNRLKSWGYQCDITDQSFILKNERNKNVWIGFNGLKHLVYSRDCPLKYCKSNVAITERKSDLQCAFNRTGLLCGTCREGYSVTLGSSECKKCSNYYLFFIIVFFLSGLLITVFLLVCNITVTTGTLSGLIFFANTLDIHRYLYTLHNDRHNTYAAVIIRLLNFDPPFQTCSYDGMDEYQKHWLGFVFPIYLLFLAGLLIMLSRRYNIVSRLVRRNGTKLLATIILLSYTKLTRSILQVFLLAKYEWEENSETHKIHIWRLDGSISYWSSRHIVCFVAALTMSLVFIVPYTLVLTFIQPLQKVNLRCINYFLTKFKPLLDAYTAPYKDTHRFWPGLLLVIRLIMFAGFIDNAELPVLVVVAVFIILFFMWSLHGVYKVPLLDALESSFYLNVGILALIRMKYEKWDIVHQYDTIILISITVATTEFLLIVFYEMHKQLLSLSRYRSAWEEMKRKLGRNILRRNVDQNEGRNDTTNESLLEVFSVDLPPVIQFDQYREPLLSSDGTIDTS